MRRMLPALMVCGLLALASATAQLPSADDAADRFFRGYTLKGEAEKLEQEGNLQGALALLEQMKGIFDAIARNHPQWQTAMLENRRSLTDAAIGRLKARMAGQPPSQPAAAAAPAASMPALSSVAGAASPLAGLPSLGEVLGQWEASMRERMRALENQNSTQQEDLQKWQQWYQWASGEITVSRQRQEKLQGDLTAKDKAIAQMQGDVAAGRASKRELEALQKERASLKDEMQKVAQRLTAAQDNAKEAAQKLVEASVRIKELEKERNTAMSQRDAAQTQAEKSRKELEALKGSMVKDGKVLAEAQQKLTAAVGERDAMRTQLEGVQKELAALKQIQKPAMAADERQRLLAENAKLKEQSLKDATELKRWQQQAQSLEREVTSLTGRSREDQSKLADLSMQLAQLQKAAQGAPMPPELARENEMLREIVMRQLRTQYRQQQVRDEVVAELQRLAAGNPALLEKVAALKEGRLSLSAQEEKLFTDPAVRELLGAGGISGTLIARVSKPADNMPAPLAATLEKAHEVFATKNYAQAAGLYQEVLRARPQEVSALLGLGYCQERQRDYRAAEDTLKACLKLDAANETALFYLGVTHFKQERWNEALGSFEKGLEVNPRNARARHYLGIIATKLSLIERAEREFKMALAIDPEFGEAHFNLAVLYATWDPPRWPEAKLAYEQAVKKGVSPDASLERLLRGSSGGAQ
jgi:Flp pilus assembly protein TadD